jgi:hypothetical protein
MQENRLYLKYLTAQEVLLDWQQPGARENFLETRTRFTLNVTIVNCTWPFRSAATFRPCWRQTLAAIWETVDGQRF